MSATKNLHKRGNIYYGRVGVPVGLRALRDAINAPNPREIFRSLATSDRKVADHELSKFKVRMKDEFDRELAALPSGGARPLTIPTAQDLAALREEFFFDELRRDEFERDTAATDQAPSATRAVIVFHCQPLPPCSTPKMHVPPDVRRF